MRLTSPQRLRLGNDDAFDYRRLPAHRAFRAGKNTLLAPFDMAADARMKIETVALYDRIDEWSGDVSPGFTKAVWDFIKAAAVART